MGEALGISGVAGFAAKIYKDLKDSRKELSESQSARVETADEHAREIVVLKSMILARRKKP